MARIPVKSTGRISSELMRAAQQRIAKLPWKKPVVSARPPVKSTRTPTKAAPGAPVPRDQSGRPVVKSTREKGYSIARMEKAAPGPVVDAADKGEVRVIRQQKKKNKGKKALWFVTNTTEKGQARQHQQLVTIKDGADTFNKSKDLWYECDCGFWKFTCDWAAWKKGASELKHSIDEPPDMKNPRYRVLPCKHIFVVCEEIIRQKL